MRKEENKDTISKKKKEMTVDAMEIDNNIVTLIQKNIIEAMNIDNENDHTANPKEHPQESLIPIKNMQGNDNVTDAYMEIDEITVSPVTTPVQHKPITENLQ